MQATATVRSVGGQSNEPQTAHKLQHCIRGNRHHTPSRRISETYPLPSGWRQTPRHCWRQRARPARPGWRGYLRAGRRAATAMNRCQANRLSVLSVLPLPLQHQPSCLQRTTPNPYLAAGRGCTCAHLPAGWAPWAPPEPVWHQCLPSLPAGLRGDNSDNRGGRSLWKAAQRREQSRVQD